MRFLAAGLALSAAVNSVLNLASPPRAHDPAGIKIGAEEAVQSAALFSLGMRRLASDIGLIRLMIYYGTPEGEAEDDYSYYLPEEDDGHGHGAGAHGSYEGGHYPQLAARAMRIMDLDPAFSYAALFTAGALAFNLDRPAQALEVLRYAMARDPKNRQYPMYIGAIGAHKKGEPREAIALLEPALSDPECPTMIKSIAAFIYRKLGEREKAVRLYRDIRDTSRDAGYRGLAEKALAELGRN